MLVTDRARLRGRQLEEVVSLAIDGGVNAVQLREKDVPARELYDLAITLRAVTRGRALLLINDRLDVALASGADGVHLPERGLPLPKARSVAGESCLVGRSVHSIDASVVAERDGADYLIAGNVFETASKPGAPATSVALIREVADIVRLPVVAIGGITADRISDVIAAGADGVAVIGALLDAPDPAPAAIALRRALDEACR
jgi:thiamine-phosphate pyrophosphorylase